MPDRIVAPRFAFDGKNERAARWASRYSARRITVIGNETKQAIRALISRAITDGIAPYDAARIIRGMVGMDEPSAMAALRYREELINSGMLPGRVETLLNRHVAKKIRERAKTIARTELMGAMNRGAQLGWKEARRQGFLSAGVKQEWMVAYDERTCEECLQLNGEQVGLDGLFGGLYDYPPAHPRCRCTVELVPESVRR